MSAYPARLKTSGSPSRDGETVPGTRRFIDQLLEGIATAVKADRATLTRIENETSVVIEGSYDVSGPAAESGQHWRISAPEVRRLIAEQRPMIQTWDPEQLPSPFREQLAGVRSMVTLPLVFEGTVFGTIAVSRRQDRPFKGSDLATLQALGSVAVLALRQVGVLAQAEAVTGSSGPATSGSSSSSRASRTTRSSCSIRWAT